MAFYFPQFKHLVERMILWFDESLLSDSAVNLILGTVAQESKFGTYLKQLKGPAIGICQMEPKTFDALKEKYKAKYPWLSQCTADEMEHDLCLAIVMCRLYYFDIKEPLPQADDIPGMARYWNRHYNRNPVKGTDQEFIHNYFKFIGGAK